MKITGFHFWTVAVFVLLNTISGMVCLSFVKFTPKTISEVQIASIVTFYMSAFFCLLFLFMAYTEMKKHAVYEPSDEELLSAALVREDYETAARLRDKLRNRPK